MATTSPLTVYGLEVRTLVANPQMSESHDSSPQLRHALPQAVYDGRVFPAIAPSRVHAAVGQPLLFPLLLLVCADIYPSRRTVDAESLLSPFFELVLQQCVDWMTHQRVAWMMMQQRGVRQP